MCINCGNSQLLRACSLHTHAGISAAFQYQSLTLRFVVFGRNIILSTRNEYMIHNHHDESTFKNNLEIFLHKWLSLIVRSVTNNNSQMRSLSWTQSSISNEENVGTGYKECARTVHVPGRAARNQFITRVKVKIRKIKFPKFFTKLRSCLSIFRSSRCFCEEKVWKSDEFAFHFRQVIMVEMSMSKGTFALSLRYILVAMDPCCFMNNLDLI